MTAHDPDVVDLHITNADPWWRDGAERALAILADRGTPFTAADLTAMGVPAPDHPARWGGLFAAARARHIIRPLGFTTSRRATRNGGACRVWIGTGTNTEGITA